MDHPLRTLELHGHPATILAQLEHELAAGKLPHGILLSGQQGIGKATLAYMFAHQLLGKDDASLGRILAGSHADLLVIQPLFDEKKEEFAREINVEQTREIAQFLSLTSGEGAWRVVIVDGADAMNIQASNSILKILEEPPTRAVIILVAHRAGRLLSTIRSRCRTIRIAPPTEDEFRDIVRLKLPEAGRELTARLGAISDHSPGLAISLYEQGAIDMLEQLELIFEDLPNLAHERIYAMADIVATGKQHANWQVFTRLVLHLMAKKARDENSGPWAEKWHEASVQLALVDARHLDYRSAVISFFHSLPSHQPFSLSA